MLYHCKTKAGNFGDDLNTWLWPRLAPELSYDRWPLFLGIGSVLNDSVPFERPKAVLGAGYAYGKPPVLDPTWSIFGVRGPLTAQRLGLPIEKAITDSAVLVRRLLPVRSPKKYPVSLIPHHQSFWHADWARICEGSRIHCIDPRGEVQHVISEIRESRLILAEAMHGAIIADTFRVPWIPVRLYGHFCEFKWRDWTSSLSLPFQPVDLDPVYQRRLCSVQGLLRACKRACAVMGVGKAKWNALRFCRTPGRQVAQVLKALERLADQSSPFLSRDSDLERLDSRLWLALRELREVWPGLTVRGKARPAGPCATSAPMDYRALPPLSCQPGIHPKPALTVC